MTQKFGWRLRNQNYEYVLVDIPEGEIVLKHKANHEPDPIEDPIANMPRRDIDTEVTDPKKRGRKKKAVST